MRLVLSWKTPNVVLIPLDLDMHFAKFLQYLDLFLSYDVNVP